MSRRRTVQRAAIAATLVVALLVLFTGRGRELPVNPEHLDYLRAVRQADGTLVLDGAWDGWSPNVLNRAAHAAGGDGRVLNVWLFSKLRRNDQGDRTRIFRVRFVPGTGGAAATSILVHGPDGSAATVPIESPPSSTPPPVDHLAGLRAEIESRPR